MKKLDKSSKIIISIILRVLFLSVISIVVFSLLLSLIVYKLDLSLDLISYLSIVVIGLCSFIVSIISTLGIKNNGSVIGMISQLPLIIYSLINTIVNDNQFYIFVIKLFLTLIIGALTGYFRVNKNKKFKVK